MPSPMTLNKFSALLPFQTKSNALAKPFYIEIYTPVIRQRPLKKQRDTLPRNYKRGVMFSVLSAKQ